MAIGAIELATIARSQDYAAIKHNENNKVITDQSNIVNHMNKEVENKTKQVHESDNTDWQKKKFDAKEKGNGQYEGGEGNKRQNKKQEDGKVLIKGQGSFDIKI